MMLYVIIIFLGLLVITLLIINKNTRPKIIKITSGFLGYNQERKNIKEKGKAGIVEALKKSRKITNKEVESLLNISDATATRYLEELEKEGRITQKSTMGGAYYIMRS